jgi:hypothetical protein
MPTQTAPQEVGENITAITIPADQVREDTTPEDSRSLEEQIATEFGDGEPAPDNAASPSRQTPPAGEPDQPQPEKPGVIPDELPDVEEDEEPEAKAPQSAQPDAAVEAIKSHTEFADARSLRPAYEALRTRCEAAEKQLREKQERIDQLTREIEEAGQVKEEVQSLRQRVANRNFEETEEFSQTIAPLKSEAESIVARAAELSLQDGKRDVDAITQTIRRMVALPDRAQRRQLAAEVFDEADVADAVAMASQLADVDRRYRNVHREWSQKAGEFLKTNRAKEMSKLREAAQTVEQEMVKRLGFVAKHDALKEPRENGTRVAEALIQLDELPPRQRAAVVQEAYYRAKYFDATTAALYQALDRLRIAKAALKRKGIVPVGDADAPHRNGKNGAPADEDVSLGDQLDAFMTTGK